jgi:redox-sensing transcriptional repressor
MHSKMKKDLPGKTIERLSQYRRILFNSNHEGKTNIYSHELARMMNLTPVQVRRDLMLIGYSGSQSKGYIIKDLISLIASIIDSDKPQNIVIVGMGNLGRAITSYFSGKRDRLSIVASFDIDTSKINRIIAGVPCHHINELKNVIPDNDVKIAILTVAPEGAHDAARLLADAGIKAIMNYTSVPLTVPPHIHLEEYDIITSLEKLAFLVKNNSETQES